MSHHQRIFCIIVTSHHSKTPPMHRGLATTSGEKKKRPHIHWKEKVSSAPSMQYGKQRYHQATFKVCALTGRPIKSPAKHYHSAITLFPVINCRSHSKAGTSYFHSPAALGMQHVSALLLSTLGEATVQLQSSNLCPSGHPVAPLCSCYRCQQCYSYLSEFGTSVSRIKVSGLPQNQFSLLIYIKSTNWHTNSTQNRKNPTLSNPHFHLTGRL